MDQQNNNKNGKVEKEPSQKKPCPDKSKVLLIWMEILLLQSVVFAIFDGKPYYDTSALSAIIVATAIVVGIVALFIRKKQRGTLRSIWIVLIIAILLFVFMVSLPTLCLCRVRAKDTVCMVNLRGIYIAAELYSQENKGYLPEAKKWGRAVANIAEEKDVFFCPADKQATMDGISLSSYAMNTEAGGKRMAELPEDMVLFFCAEIEESKAQQFKQENQKEIFEVKDRYSESDRKILTLYGGPELVSFRHMIYSDVVSCVMAGGYACQGNPAKMRWYTDQNKEMPRNIKGRINESYDKHLTRIKRQRLAAKCQIAGGLAGPYVLWLVVFIIFRYRKKY